jgi:predicted membrane protein
MSILSFSLQSHPTIWVAFIGLLMTNSQINMSNFVRNSIRLFIGIFFVVTAFFMTFFVLAATTILAFAVAIRVWWKQTTQQQQAVNKSSEKTIIDAEYTVVDK